MRDCVEVLICYGEGITVNEGKTQNTKYLLRQSYHFLGFLRYFVVHEVVAFRRAGVCWIEDFLTDLQELQSMDYGKLARRIEKTVQFQTVVHLRDPAAVQDGLNEVQVVARVHEMVALESLTAAQVADEAEIRY